MKKMSLFNLYKKVKRNHSLSKLEIARFVVLRKHLQRKILDLHLRVIRKDNLQVKKGINLLLLRKSLQLLNLNQDLNQSLKLNLKANLLLRGKKKLLIRSKSYKKLLKKMMKVKSFIRLINRSHLPKQFRQ